MNLEVLIRAGLVAFSIRGLVRAYRKSRAASVARKAPLRARITIQPESPYDFMLTMENTGAESVIFNRIELRVENAAPEQREFNVVNSRKESDTPANPGGMFHDSPAPADEAEVIESGKCSIRFIPRTLNEKATCNRLRQIVHTGKDAKFLHFVVCTDSGEFPVQAEKPVIDEIVRAVMP